MKRQNSKDNIFPTAAYGTSIFTGIDGRQKLINAVKKVAAPVVKTMGPYGENVVLDRPSGPTVTKDGVTVLYDLDYPQYDAITGERTADSIVYEMFREMSENISKEVGDGTTSVCWLTRELLVQAEKALAGGIDPHKINKGILMAFQHAMEAINDESILGNSEGALRSSLYTSANGLTEIVDTLTEVFLEVGDEGMLFIRDPRGNNTSVVYEEGFVVPVPPDTPELINEEGTTEWDDAYILVSRDQILNATQLVPVMNDIMRRGEVRRLVIAYTEMSDGAKDLIHQNNKVETLDHLRTISFRMPLYTERQDAFLEDLAALTDATVIDSKLGMKWKNIGVEQLGIAKNVSFGNYMTRILGGRGQTAAGEKPGTTRLQERLEVVKADRNQFTGNVEERTRMNERVAKLSGAIVSIHPGGQTKQEMKWKRGIYEDAILAAQAALKGGVVPGGGWSLWLAAEEIDPSIVNDYEVRVGVEIGQRALRSIFEKLCRDKGISPDNTATRIKKEAGAVVAASPWHFSLDLHTEEVQDIRDRGIVDPVYLLQSILENSASMATTIITIGCVLLNEPTEEFKAYKKKQKMEHLRY